MALRLGRTLLPAALILLATACGARDVSVPAATVAADSTVNATTPIGPDTLALASAVGPECTALWDRAVALSGWQEQELRELNTIAGRDSMQLVARLHHVANDIARDSASAEFTGLPVRIRDGWLVGAPSADTVIVFVALRRLNREADPREETTLIVATRDSVRPERLRGARLARSVGDEDGADGWELMSATRVAGQVELLVLHESANTEQMRRYGLVAGRWQEQWSAPKQACAAAR
ncbi:MAG: hypothetical protein K2X99_12560 [Gemmatimonadaceae bacterium]|nr:hypothetical protein [Gemmatimonadaceae bacterium]